MFVQQVEQQTGCRHDHETLLKGQWIWSNTDRKKTISMLPSRFIISPSFSLYLFIRDYISRVMLRVDTRKKEKKTCRSNVTTDFWNAKQQLKWTVLFIPPDSASRVVHLLFSTLVTFCGKTATNLCWESITSDFETWIGIKVIHCRINENE